MWFFWERRLNVFQLITPKQGIQGISLWVMHMKLHSSELLLSPMRVLVSMSCFFYCLGSSTKLYPPKQQREWRHHAKQQPEACQCIQKSSPGEGITLWILGMQINPSQEVVQGDKLLVLYQMFSVLLPSLKVMLSFQLCNECTVWNEGVSHKIKAPCFDQG